MPLSSIRYRHGIDSIPLDVYQPKLLAKKTRNKSPFTLRQIMSKAEVNGFQEFNQVFETILSRFIFEVLNFKQNVTLMYVCIKLKRH